MVLRIRTLLACQGQSFRSHSYSRIATTSTFSDARYVEVSWNPKVFYRGSVLISSHGLNLADSSISYRPKSPAPPFSASIQDISSILIEFHQFSSIIITCNNAAASTIHQSSSAQLSDAMGHRSQRSHGNRAIPIDGRDNDPHIS